MKVNSLFFLSLRFIDQFHDRSNFIYSIGNVQDKVYEKEVNSIFFIEYNVQYTEYNVDEHFQKRKHHKFETKPRYIVSCDFKHVPMK